MTVGLATVGFAVSLLCALLMGYAIQRGATCTVAAVSQLIETGRWGRFIGLMEAALWVAGGLLVARAFGLLQALPQGKAVTAATVVGGILLGAGAYINKSCVFGTIAKIGAGDWAYLATPFGFVGGAWAISLLTRPQPATAMPVISPLMSLPTFVLVAFLLFAGWRIIGTLFAAEGRLAERIWAPHEATVLIGIAFVILFVAAGAWAYTDLLAELAMGMPGDILVRLLLLGGLLGGSMLGGLVYGRSAPAASGVGAWLRTLVGGAAMGAGSVLIPGSNDGLILVGMPLLFPSAWVAIGTMCATILVAIHAERIWNQRVAARRAAV